MSYPQTAVADMVPTLRAPRQRIMWVAMFAIVAAGIVLRVTNYTANTSLWLDEVALVKGILGFDLIDLLTRQLPFDQIAPKGFLFAQKLAVMGFGPSDYVLRFVPFVSSVAALVAFSRFAQRALPPIGAPVATLLFATAAPFVAFAGIVKQYSTDVCGAVVLSWLALDLITRPVTERNAWRAAGIGAIVQWFSQPAVLMVAALGLPVLWWMSADVPEARRRRVAIVLGLWGVSAVAMTAWDLATMGPTTRDYMRVYWADGFAPASLARLVELRWPWPNIRLLFGGGPSAQAGLAYPLSPLYPVLAALGFGALWFQQKRVASILIAPFIVTLVTAVGRQYPFSDRLILFLVPSLIIAVAGMAATVYGVVERFSNVAGLLAVVGLTLPAVAPVARLLPPYRVEDVKHVLEYVQVRRQPGDAVYVYYAAAPVMSIYDFTFGFSRDAYAVGGCHRGDSRRYLEELDTFRGNRRVWVVLTHSLYREREDILTYLDTIGTRLDYVNIASRAVGRNPSPAEGFLYDLSAAARLTGANAESFKLTGRSDQRATCVNGPQAMIPSDFECTGLPNTRCIRRPHAGV